MTRAPSISVLMPVCNGGDFVDSAVASILCQSFSDFEFIIIDDGSSDGSTEKLTVWASRDSRIRLVKKKYNEGLVRALNLGLEMARANLIARMDADDIADPKRLETQYLFLSGKPDVTVVGSFITLINELGEAMREGTYPVGEKKIGEFMKFGCPLAHPTVMMRKTAVCCVGGYREEFKHCEDYDLWLRLVEKGYRLENISKSLLFYRVHGKSVSKQHQEAQAIATIVARAFHRAREAGFVDPVSGSGSKGADALSLLPEQFRPEAEAAVFCIKHADVAGVQRADVICAWNDFGKLDSRVARSGEMISFFIRQYLVAKDLGSMCLQVKAIYFALTYAPKAALSRLFFFIRSFLHLF